jgi:hypothetical protein
MLCCIWLPRHPAVLCCTDGHVTVVVGPSPQGVAVSVVLLGQVDDENLHLSWALRFPRVEKTSSHFAGHKVPCHMMI